MFEQLHFPWISFSVLVIALGTLLVWQDRLLRVSRTITVGTLSLSLISLFAGSVEFGQRAAIRLSEPFGWQYFNLDALNSIPLPLFTALALSIVIAAPRRKVTAQWLAGVLLLTAATQIAYAASNLIVLAIGWAGSILPFLWRRCFEVKHEKEIPVWSKLILALSLCSLISGIALLNLNAPTISFNIFAQRTGTHLPQYFAFGFFMLAVFLRKGLLPLHSWVLAAFERGPILPLTLFVNGHLGAFLVARVALPMLPDVARDALPLMGNLGLLTAAYTALLALAEKQPRRLLALLTISQSSFLLVGLESNNEAGVAGALVHWQVVIIATTMLTLVYTALEARLGTAIDGTKFLGLAKAAPRLAVFFACGGLALVGLPLTLGFPAEDLLLHGTLESHPQFGIILPIVTALNAYHVIRLFAVLFLGKPGTEVRGLPDALPRERWALTLALLFLLLGGFLPAPFIKMPVKAAQQLTAVIEQTALIGHKP